MGKTKVKICGVRSAEIVRQILHLPVDHIGFMFAESKRRITIEEAAELARLVDNASGIIENESSGGSHGIVPHKVGVFVSPSEQQLYDVLEKVPLDMIQLHLGETPEFCRWVKETFQLPVIKAISVTESDRIVENSLSSVGQVSPQLSDNSQRVKQTVATKLEPYRNAVDIVLLDTHDPLIGGGTGRTFNWEVIPFYQEWCKEAGKPLYIAGGLNADNVRQLIEEYEPDGLDVSSGVETNGAKDIDKIRAFVERVNLP